MRFCRGACPHVRSAMRSCRGFTFGARLVLRSCCGICPRFTPAVCRMATNRTACDMLRFYSARSRSPLCVLAVSVRLSDIAGSLRDCAFICGDLDGVTGRRETRGTGRLAARPLYSFARVYWLCGVFRGEYVGAKCGSRTAAAPDCAKESNVEAALPPLWTLFTLRRGWGGAGSQRRRPGTRKDLTGSDLWPVRSGCIAMLPTRSNVQTRAALKRRGVGLRARSGVEAALRLAGRVGLYCDHINTYNRRPA